MVYESEMVLRRLGFRQVRVRYHGDDACVEVPRENVSRPVVNSAEVVAGIKKQGVSYVAADLEGFRSGSPNGVLKR